MKRSDIFPVVGASILASGIALVPLTMPASAQSASSPNTNTTSSSDNASQRGADNRDNDNSKWGLLGLSGLIGLVGLAKGKRSEPATYRDPNINR